MLNLRMTEEWIIKGLCIAAVIFLSLSLFWIIGTIAWGAIPSLTLYFIFTPESATQHIGQGIANAIIGTIILSALATVFAIPLAIGTAIYLKRYAQESMLTSGIQFFIEVLSGTPSIVLGMFGFLVFVYYMKLYTGGFSLISGSIALAILIMPVIERAVEHAIESVSKELEEGSYSLGADKWQTLKGITIPVALPGILTGIILGFGRAAEESAVVILTAGYTQFMPEFGVKANPSVIFGIKIFPFQDLIASLPYAVYHAYTNSNVINMSNAFAAAFILIVIVFMINIFAKIIFWVLMGKRSSGSIIERIKKRLLGRIEQPSTQTNNQEFPNGESSVPKKPDFTTQNENLIQKPNPILNLKEKLKKYISLIKKGKVSQQPEKNNPEINAIEEKTTGTLSPKRRTHTFLRALLPFTIPALLLLLIALFATIPPLHHAFTSDSSSDAWLLISGPIIIIVIAGIYIGFLFVDHSGMFKGKSRRKGFAGVAAGICLVCIAGIICAMAAPGFFTLPVPKSAADRQAQLAALTAEYEAKESGTSVAANNAAQSSSASVQPASTSSGGVIIPVKDALSLGESYQYGDATRTVVGTVYDYQVLPTYFWWFVDYNLFVQEVPNPGNVSLVVWIRIQDIGTNSAIVPSADSIHITNNGNSYSHKLFFNKSVLSDYQTQYYSTHYDQLPYQWIRELGIDKRDYAFLTGYSIFEESNVTISNPIVTQTVTVTQTTSTNASSFNGKGFFLKPGPSNAIDGYLIFEVPYSVVTEKFNETYVDISFNANSGTRWRLK